MSTYRFSIRNAGDLGRTISETRFIKGVTQAETAAQAGLDRTYLSRLENGIETVQVISLFAAFNALGIRLEATVEHDNDSD